MKVLIIGINTKFAEVFSQISDKLILLVDQDKWGRYQEDIKKFNVISLNDRISLKNIIKTAFELRQIIKENEINVIFTNEKISMISSFLASKWLKEKPILISTSHNSYSWGNRLNTYLFSKLINKTTDGYIALASFVYKRLVNNRVDPQRILLTTNPIEYKLFSIKSDYSIKKEPHLISVGVINRLKGQIKLIEAAAILKKRDIKVKLFLVGDVLDDSYFHKMADLIEIEGLSDSIYFTGRLDNNKLRRELCNYDLYICPSLMEMSPYSILEAKASGLPVIASNVGGIPDIINDGIDGLLVSPANEFELAEKIEIAVTNYNLRKSLGTNARCAAETKHSPQSMAVQLKIFLKQIPEK